MDNNFAINENMKRFELIIDEHTAFIEFLLSNDHVMSLTHTEVPNELGGKGIGKTIVKKTLNYIKDHNYTLLPLCPFVAAYVKRNSEWQNILPKGYKIK